MRFCFPPPPQAALILDEGDVRFPVRRVYCVGRNYADHAREMGHDPGREPPFFFQKNPDNLRADGRFPYPSGSRDVHHEVELALLIGRGGRDIDAAAAGAHVFGHAVALDMTRRDLQAQAKKAGRPWEAAKAFEHSAPVGRALPAAATPMLGQARIRLAVNGRVRQEAGIADMIWSPPEIVAELSRLFELAPGDVILTGTPAGVGPVRPGDLLEASVDGLPPLRVEVVGEAPA